MLHKNRNLLFGLLLLLGLGSCRSLAPTTPPAVAPMPTTFQAGTDTASLGQMPWRAFFSDQHLVQLIDTALRHNPDLLVATQRIEQARTQVWLSRGARLPALSLGASAGVRRFGDYTIDGVGNYDTNFSEHVGGDRRIPNPVPDFFLGFQSSWEVDLWGKLRNQKKAAYARYLATERGRHLATTALISEVASRYYQLVALDNELEIIRRNLGFQETALEMVQNLKIAAMANELAVQQFRAQLLNTRSLEVQKKREIVAVENELNFLLGRFPQTIARGNSIAEQEFPKEITVGIPADMLRRRPDIQQAELELVAAKADVQAMRAAFFPSLSLTSHLGYNAFDHTLLFRSPESIAYGIVGGLTAPLWNRNLVKADFRRAQSGSLASFHAYHKAVLNGYKEVITGLRTIENLKEEEALKDQEVTALSQAVAASNDLFVAGYATYLEVITAQKNVLEAELDLVSARRNQFLSVVELYRALGGGWE